MNEFQSILKRYWGYENFRPLQEDIIRSVASGKDTLGLMPTGGGKSITFQVFSLSRPGISLVITPLISLMNDQVENLKRRNIRAMAIHSGMTMQEVKIAFDSAAWGDYKFLYLSPERITTERFRERLEQMNINLIVVDEAHCISQWGYDFRPSYLRIKELRALLTDVPVLALTASATPQVVSDIQKQLMFKQKNVLKKSFFRDNLYYLVREREDKLQYLLQAAQKAEGSGIVYVRTRKTAKEVSEYFRKNKVSADYYHAGLSSANRTRKQNEWLEGKMRIIVATNAFGMGIDKPDVRFVIHFGPPNSPEAYYQEAGRAGRDGKKSFAVMIAAPSDHQLLKKQVEKSFPEPEVIKRIYVALCNYFQIAEGFGKDQIFGFDIGDFAGRYNFPVHIVLNSLIILQREGYLELTEELDNPSRVYFIVNRDDLYRFQVANADFDGFIKLILRSYSGLFTNYVHIEEGLLAQRAKITVESVYKFLNQLDHHKIINYIPREKTPYIIFAKERLTPERLIISKENYHDRLRDFENRIDAIIRYMSNKIKCRSQILLEYFGENDSLPCGNCDICLEKKKNSLQQDEFENIKRQLKENLSYPCSYNELIVKINGQETDIIQVIRLLVDEGLINILPDNLFVWKSTSK